MSDCQQHVRLLSSGFAHGDLPTDTGEEALSFVAARPFYSVVHLGDWLGVLIWTCGLVAFAASAIDRTAWVLGRMDATCAVIGAAVHIMEFSVDGYVLPTLANAWVSAAPAERAGLESGARSLSLADHLLALLWCCGVRR